MLLEIRFQLTIVEADHIALLPADIVQRAICVHRTGGKGFSTGLSGMEIAGHYPPVPDTPGCDVILGAEPVCAGFMDQLSLLLPEGLKGFFAIGNMDMILVNAGDQIPPAIPKKLQKFHWTLMEHPLFPVGPDAFPQGKMSVQKLDIIENQIVTSNFKQD